VIGVPPPLNLDIQADEPVSFMGDFPDMRSRDLVDLLVLGAIWGASFLFMRVAAPEFGPVPLIAARVGIAAVFLVIVLARRGGMNRLSRSAVPLIVLGTMNAAVPFSLFAYAVLSVTSGFAAVLNSTAPLFGALVAFIWLRERLAPIRVAGLVIGFAGVLVLVWRRLAFADDGAGLAVLAGLAAAVLYGISANYTKRRLGDVDPLVTATGSMIAATVVLLPAAVAWWPVTSPSSVSWVSAILLGVVCTGIALILYYRLISRVGPSKTLTVTYLIPVFGVFWGRFVLDEPITSSMVVGCSVILLGTALATGGLTLISVREPRG
jgi:drug/metabolite transporter (DMT)-like permease